jgi:hypothetical protein
MLRRGIPREMGIKRNLVKEMKYNFEVELSMTSRAKAIRDQSWAAIIGRSVNPDVDHPGGSPGREQNKDGRTIGCLLEITELGRTGWIAIFELVDEGQK